MGFNSFRPWSHDCIESFGCVTAQSVSNLNFFEKRLWNLSSTELELQLLLHQLLPIFESLHIHFVCQTEKHLELP